MTTGSGIPSTEDSQQSLKANIAVPVAIVTIIIILVTITIVVAVVANRKCRRHSKNTREKDS